MKMQEAVLAVMDRTRNPVSSIMLQQLVDGLAIGQRLFVPLSTEDKTAEYVQRLLKDFSDEELDADRVCADPSFIVALHLLLRKAAEKFVTDCVDPKIEKSGT